MEVSHFSDSCAVFLVFGVGDVVAVVRSSENLGEGLLEEVRMIGGVLGAEVDNTVDKVFHI